MTPRISNKKRRREFALRRKRRTQYLCTGATVLGALGAGWFFFLRDGSGVQGMEVLQDIQGAGELPTMLYLEDDVLKSVVPGGEPEPINDQVPLRAVADPGGAWLAWPQTIDGGIELHFNEVGREEVVEGPEGTVPLWHSGGTRVAYLKPVPGESECNFEDCSGDVSVGVYDVTSGRDEVWLEDGEYALIGWGADDLFLYDRKDRETLLRVSGPGESTVMTSIRGDEASFISPDGTRVVGNTDRGIEFFALEPTTARFLGARSNPDELFQAVAWQSGGSLVAAIIQEEATSRVVLFDPEDPEFDPVEGTANATTRIFWTKGNGLVYTELNRDEEQLEALYCAYCAPGGTECDVFLEWQTGLKIVAVN